jgi:hypothetical protein
MSITSNVGYFKPPVPTVALKKQDGAARLGVLLAAAMVTIIVGTLFIGKAVAFASIPLFVVAVIVYSLTDPTKAIGVLIAYSAMEGMFKYLSGYSQVVYVIKPLLCFIILIGMALTAKSRQRRMIAPPLTVLVAVLVGWCLVDVLNPNGSGVAGGIASALVWYIAPMIALFTGYNALKTQRHVETILYAYVGVAVVVSAFTIVQYAMGQTWTEAHLPGYASMNEGLWWVKNSHGSVIATSFRPASTTSIGGDGGQWSVGGIVIAVGLLLTPGVGRERKQILSVLLLVLMTGLICCVSRLMLLTGIIGLATLFVVTAKAPRELMRNLGALLFLGLMAWAALTLAQAASGGLVANRYAQTLENPLAKYDHDRGGVGGRTGMMLGHLIPYPLGLGFQHGAGGYTGQSMYHAADPSAPSAVENRDDEFNAISYDLGWPGLCLLLALFCSVLSRGGRILKSIKDPHRRIVAGILLVLVFSAIVMCFGGPTMESNEEFWLFAACLFVLPGIERRVNLDKQEPQPQ